MRFMVVGRDGDTFDAGDNDLHEDHQSYMDGWLPRMIARGPTLSPDGELHTGSVHVIEVDDAGVAHRFAYGEPYALAGWYAEIAVNRMLACTDGTMWDKPVPPGGQASFVQAAWSPRPVAELRLPDWLFSGLLLGDDDLSIGFAGAVDLAGPDASAALRRALGNEPGEIGVQRWQRGGRS